MAWLELEFCSTIGQVEITQVPTTNKLDEQQCWDLVLKRERNPAVPFVYAVTSTGIYCRPSCPARRPLRRNVVFYASTTGAERAGYRACQRCRPHELSLNEQYRIAVEQACMLMDQSNTPPDLAMLAKHVGMSRYHFHRTFKGMMGVTPKAFFNARRRQRVSIALKQGKSVTTAIYTCGFKSSGAFYANSADMLGMNARDVRKAGKGTQIRFAVGESSMGSVIIAATKKGVCWVSMGDDPEVLVREFQDQFSEASLVGGDEEFEQLVAKVLLLVEQPETMHTLPLDLLGTAFQQRVWNALREIPPGSTLSYSQLAEKLGMKTGARAIARACATNQIAVAVPCHRVVRSDGSLSGYRWGVERKRELLRKERQP